MRFATNQTHQPAAALAKMRCQIQHFFELDLFHDTDATLQVSVVNSVSLQPIFVLTQELSQADHSAWTKNFLPSKANELSVIDAPIAAFTQNE